MNATSFNHGVVLAPGSIEFKYLELGFHIISNFVGKFVKNAAARALKSKAPTNFNIIQYEYVGIGILYQNSLSGKMTKIAAWKK